MPTQWSQPAHTAREVAESFGVDAARYDRTRPRYPDALVAEVASLSPGCELLDVGAGTGVSSRPFVAAGFDVLGVEPDARMAAFAASSGLRVEVASFEAWDAAGRTFDAIVAGTTWHWVDPRAGAERAARLLRPTGPLALFWNVALHPPAIASAFAEVYRRAVPEAPFADGQRDPLAAYEPIRTRAEEAIADTGAFDAARRWRTDWERSYTTAEWLDQVPTFGGHAGLDPAALRALLDGMAAVIEAAGGAFTTRYATVAVIARRAVA